jgi:exodeoxyribonuclease-1
MTQTYLFYDIETTGLNKSFDQVLQFAAIRTDLSLNELERHEIKIKLNPDMIPAPRALITHHIGIAESLEGVSEYQGITAIHQILNEPGTISVGYNTLGFDDEFLRFSFYRNLLTPYTHQYANRCGRLDLYPLTILYYLYKNDILQWPTIDAKITLKLESINAANQFIAGRSHHAMVDVEVTLALARQFFEVRDMWEYALGYFVKNTDQERIQQLQNDFQSPAGHHCEGLMLYGKLGVNASYQAQVLQLGVSKPYKNQSLWLRLDTPNLTGSTSETIIENAWVIRKKWGEPGIILPLKERFLAHLNQERQAHSHHNKEWLKENPALLKQLIDYHCAFTYPLIPNTDIEASLYINGFWSEDENAFCRRFHRVSPKEKANLAETTKNTRLKDLAIRLLGRNYPEILTETLQQEFNNHMYRATIEDDAIIDFKGGKRLTRKAALADIMELRKIDLTSIQHSLLDGLEKYLLQL